MSKSSQYCENTFFFAEFPREVHYIDNALKIGYNILFQSLQNGHCVDVKKMNNLSIALYQHFKKIYMVSFEDFSPHVAFLWTQVIFLCKEKYAMDNLILRKCLVCILKGNILWKI